MILAKAKAKTNETFIVQTSLTIITYDRKNMLIVQATGVNHIRLFFINLLALICKLDHCINDAKIFLCCEKT